MITLKINNDNKWKLLFTDSNSLMYEIKIKMFIKILTVIKKCFTLVILGLSQNTIMVQTN